MKSEKKARAQTRALQEKENALNSKRIIPAAVCAVVIAARLAGAE
jgi:hypothetical protein